MEPMQSLCSQLCSEMVRRGVCIVDGVDATGGQRIVVEILQGRQPGAVVWGSPHPIQFADSPGAQDLCWHCEMATTTLTIFEFLYEGFPTSGVWMPLLAHCGLPSAKRSVVKKVQGSREVP